MATTSKAQFLSEVQSLLKNRYPLEAGPEKLSILEAVVYAICHEETTRGDATRALAQLKEGFFDWNEVRVSSLEEIQGILKGAENGEARAFQVRRFLRQLFEKTYGFNLDLLLKKPQKEALKALEDYETFGADYVVATATRLALGGHAVPVDAAAVRALGRLGVAEEDAPALRGLLERAVPKNRGAEFADLLAELAHDTCVEGEPDCPRCELQSICPTGQEHRNHPAGPKATAKGKNSRAKSSD